MKCPSCGAETKGRFCEFCGSEMPRENTGTTINITNNYYGDEPRQRTTNTANVRPSNTTARRQPPKKKSKTWLWVLGWIFIFPVPLTILMLRNKKLKPAVKYAIIAVAWIFYLIIGFSGSSDSSSSSSTSDTVSKTEDVVAPTVEVEQMDIAISKDHEANDIEKIFLAVTPDTTEEQFVSLIEQSGLVWHSKEYSGSKKISYRAAYEESTATFWKADGQQCIEASFSNGDREIEDGSFCYAELFMGLSKPKGFIYKRGTYWEVRDNLDAGYYTVGDVNHMETYEKRNSANECLSALCDNANIVVNSAFDGSSTTGGEYAGDKVVNQFITDYQSIAGYQMDDIHKGNIRTKYYASINSCYTEMINATNELADATVITINFDNASTEQIYDVFKNTLKVFGASDEDIQKTINAFTVDNDGDYMVFDYQTNDSIVCQYSPTKELSKGLSYGHIEVASSTYGK